MMGVQRATDLQKRTADLGNRAPGLGLLLGGLFIVFWGFLEASIARQLRWRGRTAKGTVVRNVRSTDSNTDGHVPMPVIAFTDIAGNQVEFSTQATGPGMTLSTGSTVEVIYPPEAPHNARVNSRAHLAGPPLLAVIVGLVVQAIVTAFVVAVVMSPIAVW